MQYHVSNFAAALYLMAQPSTQNWLVEIWGMVTADVNQVIGISGKM